MKDSGVESLGEVPKHWEVQPIGRMGRLFKGNGGSKEDEVPAGVPCVRYGDLYSRHEYFITCAKGFVSVERATDYTPIRYGDLLFAASGETIEDIGRSAVSLMQTGAVCGGDLLLMRPKVAVLPEYLGYAADSAASREQKARMGRGFTVVHIYRSQLRRLALPLPPVTEQAAIVRFLGHVDRRIRRYIRAKQKLIKLLEEQKQAIIHQAVTRGLDPNVAQKPSGVGWLGDVPEHWDVVRNGRLFLQRNETGSPDLPILEVSLRTGVRHRDMNSSERKQIMADRSKYKRVRAGDIAYNTMRMWQGAVGVAPSCGLVSPAYVVAAPVQGAEPRYFGHLFRTESFMGEADRNSRGIVKDRNRLYWEDFRGMLVCCPPSKEQVAIADAVDSTCRQIAEATNHVLVELNLLGELRSRLIADVVTGKLDVREAAARLPDEGDEPDGVDEVDEGVDAIEESDDELVDVLEGVEA